MNTRGDVGVQKGYYQRFDKLSCLHRIKQHRDICFNPVLISKVLEMAYTLLMLWFTITMLLGGRLGQLKERGPR